MVLRSFRRGGIGGDWLQFQWLFNSQRLYLTTAAYCSSSSSSSSFFSTTTTTTTSRRYPLHTIHQSKVVGYRKFYVGSTRMAAFLAAEQRTSQTHQDPFSLVADELVIVANRIRSMVLAEVPKLASAAEYFFRNGVEGKRFRPTILLLMASALHTPIPGSDAGGVSSILTKELRAKQQCIAEVAEMIHVASLLHDDVLDDADTRRGINSLNSFMGNKLAVLSGDFLLSRACAALVSLKNIEVIALIITVIENLVTGETMQMVTATEQRSSLEYYLQKTYYKTASLIANSCKCIALIEGQTAEVSKLAYEYGRNLGLAFQLIDDVLDFTGTSASLGKGSLSDIRHGILTAPILFAMEEFPQLHNVVQEGFDNAKNVDIALDYLGKSQGIERARELAAEHINFAIESINALPESDDKNARISRQALVELAHMVLARSK